MLATLYLIIAMLFCFATSSVPGTLDVILLLLIAEPSHPELPRDLGETLSGIQCIAIISICATGLTLGVRQIPAGFHVTVTAGGAEWQTSNLPVHVDQAVMEWNECILLPSEPVSKVLVSVYVSFELGPMLSHGELLCTFNISVGELLEHSEKSDHASHHILAQYSRMQNSRDLDRFIMHFRHTSDLCPVGHPCRPVTLFNLAFVKVISCQGNESYLDLDITISLFQDTLDLRPTGHLDHAVTELHLAVALLSRFMKWWLQADADAAEELLSDVLHTCLANSHMYRAAVLVIKTSALHPASSINVNDPGQEQPIGSMLPLSPESTYTSSRVVFARR
ncbi:hypothetical protein F4604DRAFT_1679180 [Suillus subluteus]|nr:hypothetical protein F4604DRAFT_1679180 [Suillus subluteus]